MARFAVPAFGADDSTDEQVIPFVDAQPMDSKRPMVKWEDLTQWMTPEKEFFAVSHYGLTKVDASSWRLKVEGLVEKPLELSLDDLKSRTKRKITGTLECSGNGASAGFMGAIGNATWTGTPLLDLLKEAGVKPGTTEIAFWGADRGKEKIRNKEYEQNFARTLTRAQITEDVLLAWEMNDQPLSMAHGFPLRLIVPGWFGIAWVKWLTRIEVRDRPLMNRFTARDYVTIRGEHHGSEVEWKETAVGPLQPKSLVGRVTRRSDGTIRITGAAWSRDAIKSVEVQIDGGKWLVAKFEKNPEPRYAWTFWSYDWKNPKPGEHTIVSCATDVKGRMQPGAEDDEIKLKQTYWEANQRYPRKIKLNA